MGKFQQLLEADIDKSEDKYWEVCTTHLNWWPCYVKRDQEARCKYHHGEDAQTIVVEYHNGTLTREQATAEMARVEMEWANA